MTSGNVSLCVPFVNIRNKKVYKEIFALQGKYFRQSLKTPNSALRSLTEMLIYLCVNSAFGSVASLDFGVFGACHLFFLHICPLNAWRSIAAGIAFMAAICAAAACFAFSTVESWRSISAAIRRCSSRGGREILTSVSFLG